MKVKFSLAYEWQQFYTRLHLNFFYVGMFLFLYAFFFYRYSWLVKEANGTLLSFLQGGETILVQVSGNSASLLFYLLPMIILGESWLRFMTTIHPLFRIRQHFSPLHYWLGEGFLFGINFIWLSLNQGLCLFFHLPFGDGIALVNGMFLLMLIANLLLLFQFFEAYFLGWVAILLFMILCATFPSILVWIWIPSLLFIMFNAYFLKKQEVL